MYRWAYEDYSTCSLLLLWSTKILLKIQLYRKLSRGLSQEFLFNRKSFLSDAHLGQEVPSLSFTIPTGSYADRQTSKTNGQPLFSLPQMSIAAFKYRHCSNSTNDWELKGFQLPVSCVLHLLSHCLFTSFSYILSFSFRKITTKNRFYHSIIRSIGTALMLKMFSKFLQS